MKATTKTTIQGYVMNSVILLLLWSGVPFFTSLGGIFVWSIAIFVTALVPLIFLGLYISDGTKLDEPTHTVVKSMKETLGEKMWVRKFIGWGIAVVVAWSLYEHGWYVIAHYWIILTLALNVIVIPLLRSQVNTLMEECIEVTEQS